MVYRHMFLPEMAICLNPAWYEIRVVPHGGFRWKFSVFAVSIAADVSSSSEWSSRVVVLFMKERVRTLACLTALSSRNFLAPGR